MKLRNRQTLDLSDEAFDYLKDMARSASYMQIAPFVMDCALIGLEWYDARPDALRMLDTPGLPMIWSSGSPRYGRTLVGLPSDYLVTIAQSHHIRAQARQNVSISGYDPARRIVTMGRADTPRQLMCAVLEAIGLGYLKPVGTLPTYSHADRRKFRVDKSKTVM